MKLKKKILKKNNIYIYIYIYIFFSLETKPNFALTGKCFSLINFFNGKQTQESLKSDFPENEFRKTNIAKIKDIDYTK